MSREFGVDEAAALAVWTRSGNPERLSTQVSLWPLTLIIKPETYSADLGLVLRGQI